MAKKGYVVGRANVFADLGHPRPAEALANAELARKIGALIRVSQQATPSRARALALDRGDGLTRRWPVRPALRKSKIRRKVTEFARYTNNSCDPRVVPQSESVRRVGSSA